MKNIINQIRAMIADTMLSWAISLYPAGERKIELAEALSNFWKNSIGKEL